MWKAFACGNVLHVHDLVDFVSGEAEIAGLAAAEYILNKSDNEKCEISVKTDGKIRYTVPQKITKLKDVKVYFRVSDVYKNAKINVLNDCGEVIYSKKKIALAPGEMEAVELKKESLENASELAFSLELL